MFKAFINFDLIFIQNLFPKLVIAQDNARFRIETSIQTFDALVRCTLMGNQPWPQFQSGIRERSIGIKSSMTSISFIDTALDNNQQEAAKVGDEN